MSNLLLHEVQFSLEMPVGANPVVICEMHHDVPPPKTAREPQGRVPSSADQQVVTENSIIGHGLFRTVMCFSNLQTQHLVGVKNLSNRVKFVEIEH